MSPFHISLTVRGKVTRQCSQSTRQCSQSPKTVFTKHKTVFTKHNIVSTKHKIAFTKSQNSVHKVTRQCSQRTRQCSQSHMTVFTKNKTVFTKSQNSVHKVTRRCLQSHKTMFTNRNLWKERRAAAKNRTGVVRLTAYSLTAGPNWWNSVKSLEHLCNKQYFVWNWICTRRQLAGPNWRQKIKNHIISSPTRVY